MIAGAPDGPHAHPRAVPPRRLGARGEGGWLENAGLQGRRPGQPERARHTRRFADIAAAIAKLPARTLLLDGEVTIFDQRLRSRFEWLREPDPDAVATPLFMALDLLYQDRRDLTARPLRDRRARLEALIANNEQPNVRDGRNHRSSDREA